jgi:hypothetical protein
VRYEKEMERQIDEAARIAGTLAATTERELKLIELAVRALYDITDGAADDEGWNDYLRELGTLFGEGVRAYAERVWVEVFEDRYDGPPDDPNGWAAQEGNADEK